MSYFSRLKFNIQNYGVSVTVKKLAEIMKRHFSDSTVTYQRYFAAQQPGEAELEQERKKVFPYRPCFSILVPLYETEEPFLRALIRSVRAQTYENWELCLSDGSRDPARLREMVTREAAGDRRIHYIAEEKGPLGISENTNQAFRYATGDYLVLCDHDDMLTPDALYRCTEALNEAGGTAGSENEVRPEILYTDEDKISADGKHLSDPHFKPDFAPDLLNAVNYICHMTVVSCCLATRIAVKDEGGRDMLFRPDFDGAQDYDFIFRCVEKTDRIRHIPRVLYHWRVHPGSTALSQEEKDYTSDAGKRAIEAHLTRTGQKASVTSGEHPGSYRVKYEITGRPLVSVLIPSQDHLADLETCVRSVAEKSTYRNIEFVIAENNSREPETFQGYQRLEREIPNLRVVTLEMPGGFNYSRINNQAVEQCRGEYILFLNNDTEMISPDAVEDMLGFCQQKAVGAVGARLYYRDGTLQHAGVIVGIGGTAGSAFQFQNEKHQIWFNRSSVTTDYSAVTAACMMVKKTDFQQAGGFDESLAVAFNDIDFCLKIRKCGLRIVYDAAAKWYHYESKSRGLEDTPEKEDRFRRESQIFARHWQDILQKGDPYYNPNLSLSRQDFSIRQPSDPVQPGENPVLRDLAVLDRRHRDEHRTEET